MSGGRAVLLAALAMAGCFGPEARDGLPCSEGGACPPGQSCQAGTCRSPHLADAAVVDAAPADAAGPAPPGAFGPVEYVPLTCPGPMTCLSVRDPFLNEARTTILFSYLVNAVNGNHDIYLASRATPDAGFLQAGTIGTINSTFEEHTPFLSDDGTTLWFARRDISSGAPVRPYDQIQVSVRVSGPFDVASPVEGGVNTLLGSERSPSVLAAGQLMLFTRASESAPTDHDVYLARFEGGQWNTIELVRELSAAGGNDRSLAVVEDRQTIFFIRDDQIHEAIWSGGGPTEIALEIVHPELDADPLDTKVGLWASSDGSEVWFDSNRGGTQQIYRAVRVVPTGGAIGSSGGRIRRRPIR